MTEKLLSDEEKRIQDNILKIKSKMAEAAIKSGRKPEDITLEAVTKTMPSSAVNAAIKSGVKIIGENRVQELIEKFPQVKNTEDCAFHIIGHLQTNKVKYIIDKVDMIESLDSIHLAAEIDKQAKKINTVMKVLIEINIGNEESKSGIKKEDLHSFIDNMSQFNNIMVCGLMAVPPKCEKTDELRTYFQQMNKLFIDIKNKKSDNINIRILSMGMSSDFDIAIEEGSNLVRIGSSIFGKRKYREASL